MAEIRRSQSGDRLVLTFSGELTVAHAGAMKAELLGALQDAAAVEVAVEKASAIDISFPQLLCSAHRAAANMKKQMTITAAGQESFGAMLRSAGFARHIGCLDTMSNSCLFCGALET